MYHLCTYGIYSIAYSIVLLYVLELEVLRRGLLGSDLKPPSSSVQLPTMVGQMFHRRRLLGGPEGRDPVRYFVSFLRAHTLTSISFRVVMFHTSQRIIIHFLKGCQRKRLSLKVSSTRRAIQSQAQIKEKDSQKGKWGLEPTCQQPAFGQ